MKSKWTAAWAAMGMAVLILDSKTALTGAREGLEVCMVTVIPSLFPFLVLSIVLNAALMGQRFRLLAPLARLLRVPAEAMGLVVVGLLGGYPVGAQGVAEACRAGRLRKQDGQRMLAFCSNAGPAFLFGIGGRLFEERWVCFLVWGIHIAASWCVALLTPCSPPQPAGNATGGGIPLPLALRKAIAVLATVCGWVVLFRIGIAFGDKWALWAVSGEMRVFLIGVTELANGCCALMQIGGTGLRMGMFAMLLSFGGLCVALQTASVCEGLPMGLYLPGKLCQGAVSLLLSIPAQLLLAEDQRWVCGAAPVVACCTMCVVYHIYARCEIYHRMCKRPQSVKNGGSFSGSHGI